MPKKFSEAIKDVMDAMRDAEVKVAYFVKDPDKEHDSAVDQKLYVKRASAEKAAKELSKKQGRELSIEAWKGMHHKAPSKTPYGAPMKYEIVED